MDRGFIDKQAWVRAINGADTTDILKSRGVSTGVSMSPFTENVQTAINTIAAALVYNQLSHDDGYDAFDVDEDGQVSLSDLVSAVTQLQLEISEGDCRSVFESLDAGKTGFIPKAAWLDAMTRTNSEEILKSRGIDSASVTGQGALAPSSVSSSPAAVPSHDKVSSAQRVSAIPSLAQVQTSVDMVAASLVFNKLSPDDGYDAFDADEDGVVSFADLASAVAQLNLDISDSSAADLFAYLSEGNAAISRSCWVNAMQAANTTEVLKSRGINTAAGVTTDGVLQTGAGVETAINTIAAALAFNQLSPEDGYDAFDADEDGQVSLSDLVSAVTQLQLEISEGDCRSVFESLDAGKTGFIPKAAWLEAIAGANTQDILKSRGVTIIESEVTPPMETAATPPAPRMSTSPPTSGAQSAAPTQESVQGSIDIVAASLQFNELSPEDGYDAVDADEDGYVSLPDLKKAAEQLALNLDIIQIEALHRFLDVNQVGIADKDRWVEVMASANTEDVLRSRGVASTGVATTGVVTPGMQTSEAVAGTGGMQTAINTIAAALVYNQLSPEDGYDAFDADEDGQLSLSDLVSAVTQLQLEISEGDCRSVFESLDAGKTGFIPKAAWLEAIAGANTQDILKSRGIDFSALTEQGVGKSIPVKADTMSSKDLSSMIRDHAEIIGASDGGQVLRSSGIRTDSTASAPGTPAETAAAATQPKAAPALSTKVPSFKSKVPPPLPLDEIKKEPRPMEKVAEEPAVKAAPIEEPSALTAAAATQPKAAPALSTKMPSFKSKVPPPLPLDEIKKEPRPMEDVAEEPAVTAAPIEEPSALTAAAATQPKAAPALSTHSPPPAWEAAVSFTLTLDIDFASISSPEEYKTEFIKDIAFASNTAEVFFKFAGLRAGSIINEILVAPGSGNPDSIIQGLIKQLDDPNSRLLQGKWTRKSIAIAPATNLAGGVLSEPLVIEADTHEKDANLAATKIQSIARGKAERKRHTGRKARKQKPMQTEAEKAAEEMAANQAFADLDKAATKIQSIARGKAERKRHTGRKAKKQKPVQTEAEKEAEEISANQAFADLDKAATKIQSIARGKAERKRHTGRKAKKQKPVQTEAEKEAEEISANQAFADLDKAATKIQSIARGKAERKRHTGRKAKKQKSVQTEADGDLVAGVSELMDEGSTLLKQLDPKAADDILESGRQSPLGEPLMNILESGRQSPLGEPLMNMTGTQEEGNTTSVVFELACREAEAAVARMVTEAQNSARQQAAEGLVRGDQEKANATVEKFMSEAGPETCSAPESKDGAVRESNGLQRSSLWISVCGPEGALDKDRAATLIQTRARGMIDRKKVKEKRRRHRGGRKNAAKPAAKPTVPSNSAASSATTGKEREFYKQNIAAKKPSSTLELPSSGGGDGGAPINVFQAANRYAEPLRGTAGGPPVEDLMAVQAQNRYAEPLRAAAAPTQLAAAPGMPDPFMMKQLEELSSENAELKSMFKEAEKMLDDMQAKCDAADKLKAFHLAELEKLQAKCMALEAKLETNALTQLPAAASAAAAAREAEYHQLADSLKAQLVVALATNERLEAEFKSHVGKVRTDLGAAAAASAGAAASDAAINVESEYLLTIFKLESQFRIALEANSSLEQELKVTVAKLHKDVATSAGSADSDSIVQALQLEYHGVVTQLLEQLTSALECNAQLQAEVKAFMAKLGGEVEKKKLVEALAGAELAGAHAALLVLEDGQRADEAASEVDYARAFSDVQAELHQALAANQKLEVELRKVVRAAPAQEGADAQGSENAALESHYQGQMQELRKYLQEALQANSAIAGEVRGQANSVAGEVKLSTEGVHMPHSTAQALLAEKEAHYQGQLQELRKYLHEALQANSVIVGEVKAAAQMAESKTGNAAAIATGGAYVSNIAALASLLGGTPDQPLFCQPQDAEAQAEMQRKLGESIASNGMREQVLIELAALNENLSGAVGRAADAMNQVQTGAGQGTTRAPCAAAVAARGASSATDEVAELTAKVEMLQAEVQQAMAALETANSDCEEAIEMQRKLESLLEQMVPRAQMEALEARAKQLAEERDQTKLACDSALQKCEMAALENAALQKLASAVKDAEAASAEAEVAAEVGKEPAALRSDAEVCVDRSVDELASEVAGTVYARALSDVQAELHQCLAANHKLEEELRKAMSEVSAAASTAAAARDAEYHQLVDSLKAQLVVVLATNEQLEAEFKSQVGKVRTDLGAAAAASAGDYEQELESVKEHLEEEKFGYTQNMERVLVHVTELEQELDAVKVQAMRAVSAAASTAAAAREAEYHQLVDSLKAQLVVVLATNEQLEAEFKSQVGKVRTDLGAAAAASAGDYEQELESVKEHLEEEKFGYTQNMERVLVHVTELEQELDAVKVQVATLEEQLDEQQFDNKQKMEHAAAHVTELEQELSELRQKLEAISAARSASRSAREEELSEAQSKLASIEEGSATHSSVLQEVVATLQSAVQAKDEELQAKEAALEASRAELTLLASVRAKMTELETLRDELQAKNIELLGKVEELDAAVNTAKAGKARAETEMEGAMKREAVLQGQLDGKQITIQMLEEQLAKTKGLAAPAGSATDGTQLHTALKRNEELEQAGAAKELELAQARSKLAQVEKELVTLKSAMETQDKERARAVDTASAAVKELNDMKTRTASIENKLEVAVAQAQAADSKVTSLETQLAAKTTEVQSLSARAAELQGMLSDAKASELGAPASEEGALKARIAELEGELAEAEGRLASNKGVDALQQQVTALTRDVKRLVETGRELGEEGRRQREELRQAESVKAELTDSLLSAQAEVARLREQKSSHSTHSESARSALESRYLESESKRQNLEVDMKLAIAERTRLREEVERLSKEVTDERVQVNRLQHELENERLRSTGSFAASPSRQTSPSRVDRQMEMQLRESEERCRELEDELHELKARSGSDLGHYDSPPDVSGLRQELARREEEVRDLQQQLASARHHGNDDWGAQHERYASDRESGQLSEGTGCSLCHERNIRIRTLLKDKAECHAQVRQLSSEVVGLTEALEMLTMRAKEKDSRHHELQAKMEKIVRLAGLVDPLLALDARAGPMEKGGPRKKKLRAKGGAKSTRQPSPAYSREERSLTPPRRHTDQLRSEAWQDMLSSQPNMMVPIAGAAPARPTNVQMTAGRPRPKSARARMEDWERQVSAGMPFSMAHQVDTRQEYYPERATMQRPMSANASSDSANLAPYPPSNPPRRPAPLDVRGQNSAYSSARPSPVISNGPDSAHYPSQAQGFVGNMRPFSYLVKCVKEGSITPQTELRIVIEYCNSEHYSRRHDIARYQHIFDRVTTSLRDNLRGRYFTISSNKESGNRNALDVEPRAGAFEIYVEWSDAKAGSVNAVVLFSKLETLRYPNPANVAARLRAVLNGGGDTSDVGNLGESDA
jgi:Ca2+-binding EF-hand superfamily protein/chromosome segregation ATPase